jgi:hypothetical protein
MGVIQWDARISQSLFRLESIQVNFPGAEIGRYLFFLVIDFTTIYDYNRTLDNHT